MGAGEVGNGGAGGGREGGSEQGGGRVEGGKREETSLLEGLGVWVGLGLHLPPDTPDTPDTPALRVNGMQWSDTSHHKRETLQQRPGGCGTSSTARVCMWTDTLCVCVCSKSNSAGSHEAGDGCSARPATGVMPDVPAVSYCCLHLQHFVFHSGSAL